MKGTIIGILAAFAIVFCVSTSAFAGDAAKGKALFDGAGKCKTCHKTDDKKLVGPGLAGVKAKHSEAWLKKWIANPQEVWASDDADVKDLKKRVNKEGKPKTAMAPGKLSEGDIDDIVAFINTL
jgi:cytochrome c2